MSGLACDIGANVGAACYIGPGFKPGREGTVDEVAAAELG